MNRISACLVLLLTAIALVMATDRSGHSNPPAVQAVVPYNGAVYNGPAGLTPEQARQLLARLESIDTKLDVLYSIDERLTGPAAKTAAAPKLQWNHVVLSKCASCHGAKEPKGDFILVNEDGKAVKPLNAREWVKVAEAVESGHMPPPAKGKLTPAEKAAFRK